MDLVAYGMGILLMTKRLNSKYPDVPQSCYACEAGELGTFDHVNKYFKVLKRNGPVHRYFPDPTKRILVVHPPNLESGEEFVQGCGFKVCTDARSLGGYIEDDKTKGDCVKYCMEKWDGYIRAISKRADKYPQDIYAAGAGAVQSK